MAQPQGDTSVVAPPNVQPLYRYHIAIMGGLAEGDGTLGRDGGEAIFSTFFSYSLTSWLESEFAFHYMPVQRIFVSGSQLPFISLSSIFDVSLMARPFAGLRIGAGISLRHITAAMKSLQGYSTVIDSMAIDPRDRLQVQNRHYQVSFDEAPSLAINIKLEYLIPLTPMFDLGIRAQAFLLPYELRLGSVSATGSSLAYGRGGLGSLGVYLRMNW